MNILRAIDRFWRYEERAERLAWLRIAIGGYALGYLVLRAPYLARYATYAPEQMEAVGVVSLVDRPLVPGAVYALIAAAIVAGVPFVLGLWFRWTAPVFAGLVLWVITYANSWGKIQHTENLFVLHLIVLALCRSADARSLDAKRARGRGEAPIERGVDYGWPIHLLTLITVCSYFVAAIAKLQNTGWHWVDAAYLRNYVAFDNVRKIELGSLSSPIGTWLVQYEWVFLPFAAGSMALELVAPLALFFKRFGRVWAALIYAFHIGVLVVMAIGFPYQALGVAFLSFFDWPRPRTAPKPPK